MLRKIGAIALLILTALPFTAPFPTCDVASLLGEQAAPHDASIAPTVEDGSQTPPLCEAFGSIRVRTKVIAEFHTAADAGLISASTSNVDRAVALAGRHLDRSSPLPLRI